MELNFDADRPHRYRISRTLVETFMKSNRQFAEVIFTEADYKEPRIATTSLRAVIKRMNLDDKVEVYQCLDRVYIERK